MKKQIAVLALCAVLFALGFAAEAQQSKKVPRIGMVLSGSLGSDTSGNDAFKQGLQELGHVEGQNIVIEYRYAEGKLDRLPSLVAELARVKVDVIVVQGTEPALAAKQHTSTIPIIMAHVGDPVARGIIVSLARPGGNITGLTSASPDLSGKRLELLKETVPGLSRVGVFWSPASQGSTANFKEINAAARTLGMQVQSLELRSFNECRECVQNSNWKTNKRSHRGGVCRHKCLRKANRGTCDKEPVANDVRARGACGIRRADVLRAELS